MPEIPQFPSSKQVSCDVLDPFLTPDGIVKLDVVVGNEAILFQASRLNFINSSAPLMRVIIRE